MDAGANASLGAHAAAACRPRPARIGAPDAIPLLALALLAPGLPHRELLVPSAAEAGARKEGGRGASERAREQAALAAMRRAATATANTANTAARSAAHRQPKQDQADGHIGEGLT